MCNVQFVHTSTKLHTDGSYWTEGTRIYSCPIIYFRDEWARCVNTKFRVSVKVYEFVAPGGPWDRNVWVVNSQCNSPLMTHGGAVKISTCILWQNLTRMYHTEQKKRQLVLFLRWMCNMCMMHQHKAQTRMFWRSCKDIITHHPWYADCWYMQVENAFISFADVQCSTWQFFWLHLLYVMR